MEPKPHTEEHCHDQHSRKPAVGNGAASDSRSHACTPAAGIPWWKDQGFWALVILAVGLSAGFFVKAAAPVSQSLWFYLTKAGWAVALGLLLGGIIDQYIPKEYISLWLAGGHRRTILASAGLGFLASSCSHGCLALSMELYRKGASVPAVITFLLASPWASMSLTLLILSLMGGEGLLIVVMALVVAAFTGFIFQRLERRGLISSNPHTVQLTEGFSIREDLQKRFRQRRWDWTSIKEDLAGVAQGAWQLGRMVLLWVALGFTLSAVLGSFIPHTWWNRFMGPTFLGLVVTLAAATLIEVCSEGTAPLAVELYRRTGALGNAFGFLMGGVVTDVTELSVVWANLGREVVFWMLVVTLPQVFLLGMILNLVR